MGSPRFLPWDLDGDASEMWNSEEGEDLGRRWRVAFGACRGFRCLRDGQGPPGGSWVYKCGAQREVSPGERLTSSQHIGGNEAMSLGNNIPMGESVYCEK